MDSGNQSPMEAWWVSQLPTSDAGPYMRLVEAADRRDARARERRTRDLGLQVAPDQVPTLVDILAASVAAEDLGGIAAENLLRVGDVPRPLKARLVRAAWDEVRHAALFENLARALEEAHGAARTTDKVGEAAGLLGSQLTRPTTDLEFAVVHTALEALALEFFAVVARSGSAARIKATYRTVEADESTHVALGLDFVEHLAVHRPPLAEERFAELIEGCMELTPLNDPEAMAQQLEPFGARLPDRFLDHDARRDRLMTRLGRRMA